LRGELDWIVMKALEKDRARRYESASELASDVERHLRHEAVAAGPPSAAYRLRKRLRRLTRGRRVALPWAIVATLLLIALVGFIVTVQQMRVAQIRAAESRAVAEAEMAKAEMARRDAEAQSQRRQEATRQVPEAPKAPPGR
jgi:hypothetical protein